MCVNVLIMMYQQLSSIIHFVKNDHSHDGQDALEHDDS